MSSDKGAALHSKWDERGYVTPLAALLLIPLLVFAAFSVDVGGWLAQATKAQNAADAAALAAAVHLPNQTVATQAAKDLAAANEFVDGVEGVSVVVTFPRENAVRVSVTEPSDFFLAQVVMDTPFTITRYADAEAFPPIVPGVPTNVLGFGPYSLDGSPVSNYWLAEGNDCTEADEGDWRAAQSLNRPWCDDAAPVQPQWKGATNGRTGGYFYIVQIPPGMTESSRLYVFDPGTCPHYDQKPMDPNFNSEEVSTTISIRQWDTRQTYTRRSDDVPITPFWSVDDCARDVLPIPTTGWTDKTQGWTATPFVFPGNASGRTETHLIQTVADGAKRRAVNNFAFWVKPQNGTSCLTVAPGACPTISADEWMPISIEGNGMGLAEDVFLTEVDPRFAGQDLIIKIWDPGEEMENLQILDPLGQPLDFTWTTDDPAYGTDNPADDCGGRPCLYIGADDRRYPPKIATWMSDWKFNGRMVTFTIPLDAQTPFSQYPHYWFRIRYTPPSNRWVRDWITYSVEFSGDYVRLVD